MSAPAHSAPEVARRAWYGLLAQAVDKVLPVALLLYLARVLDGAAFGVYSFVLAYLAFFQVVSDTSIDTVLVRTMSQDPAGRDDLLQAGLALKLVMALASAAVAVAFVGVASSGATPASLMAVASLNLPTALGGAYRAWHRARLEIHALFFQAALRAVLLAVGVVAAVTQTTRLEAVFLAMSAANLATFAVVAVALRREVSPRLRFDPALWRRLAAGAVPLMLNAFAMTLSLRIGQVLLMGLRGPVDVGRLGAASRVTEAFTLLPEALMLSVYPLMAGLHAAESPALLAAAGRSTRYLVAATGLPVVLCAVAGDRVMAVLFGPPFAEAGPVLSVLSLMALFGATGTVVVNLLVATHSEKALLRNTVVFSVVGAAASWAGIASYGVVGAAAASVATSAASQLALAFTPATRRYVRAVLGASLRPLAAVGVAVATAAAAGEAAGLGEAAQAATALAAYVAAAAAFGAVGADEWRLLRSLRSSGPRP